MKQYDIKLKLNTFDLDKTLNCGQCFRWKKITNTPITYVGIIQDRVIKIWQEQDMVYVISNVKEGLREAVEYYFDLDTNYFDIEQQLLNSDDCIKKCIDYSSGIHILKQPIFETYISYIISANNNIKRISKSVDLLSEMAGKKVEFEGECYYLFPSIQEMKTLTQDDFLRAGCGFRARYLLNNLKTITSEIVFEDMRKEATNRAFDLLVKHQGIGPKVADCILLFSMHRLEVFPVDTWIKRIMEKVYYKQNTTIKEIREDAQRRFGKYAGIAQEHLFINVREGNI